MTHNIKKSESVQANVFGIKYPISKDRTKVFYDNKWYEGIEIDGYFRITHEDHSIVDFDIEPIFVSEKIQLQIIESVNSCEGRISNGADIEQAFNWFRDELDKIFKGESVNDTSLTR